MFKKHVKVVFGHDLTFIMTILMEEYKKLCIFVENLRIRSENSSFLLLTT